MPQPTQDQVLDALRQVIDPDLHQDIVTLGFVTRCEVTGNSVDLVINLTTPACPMKDQLRDEAHACVSALDGVEEVNIEMTAVMRNQENSGQKLAENIKHIIAVSSGKGGVGKSTVSVNLACALAATGAKVGLLDCDIYGPDIPMMMGMKGHPDQGGSPDKPALVPKERFGVKTMSVGYLLEDDKPAVWRGPMVHKLIEQFLTDVEWGELDYLLVDMPPGTGDAQLSLAQLVPLTGAIIVTTPQAVATFDVTKAITMFKQVNTEILGIVENMSGLMIEGLLSGVDEGTPVRLSLGSTEELSCSVDSEGRFRAVAEMFGHGGAKMLAEKHGFPMLGSIPLDPAVRLGGDDGDPVVVSGADSPLGRAFQEVAGKAAQRIAVRSFASLPVLD